MRLPEVETGLLDGCWPFAKVGEGDRTLIVFPGIHDALQDVIINPRLAAWFCRALSRGRTVYLLSRRHELPQGFSLHDMAIDYHRVGGEHFERPDVLGISMGSGIAQEYAATFPDRVDRLVLATAGCRLSPGARPICHGWRDLAQRGAWRELYLDLIDHAYGRSRRVVFEAMLPKSDDAFTAGSSVSNDFIVSVKACMDFDTTDRVPGIRARTLIIGGMEDALMPPSGLRELADRIPRATLRLIERAGHGVFEERKEEFDQAIIEFLDAEERAAEQDRPIPK